MSLPERTPLLVLHDAGDEAGGSPWRAAFESSGWPGLVIAPDLPGHGDEPAPVGGSYELVDAAWFGVGALSRHLTDEDALPVIVGVGINGWSAEILAVAGRSAGLVMVDGLGGPWMDAASAIDAGRRWLRSLASDPAALAPAPPGRLDPRLRHGLPPHGDRRLAERTAAALKVPVLLIESGRSGLSATERQAIVELIPEAAVAERPEPTPETVADCVVRWWSRSAA